MQLARPTTLEPKWKSMVNGGQSIQLHRFSQFSLILDEQREDLMSTSTPPSFPVRQKTFCLNLKGHKTDFIISSYEDHYLVIVTQLGTMGTILHARKEEGVSSEPTYYVSVMFGKRDEPMLSACARQIVQHISSLGYSKPLVLSLGLKDHSMETIKGVVSAVRENFLC